MKARVAALVAASILITPALALARNGADDVAPRPRPLIGVVGSTTINASTTIKARIEDRMDRREDRQENRRDRREDRKDDRLEKSGHASSTASTTKPFKRPMPQFLGWIFGHSDDTTLGAMKAQIVASSSASSTPAQAQFFSRLRALFHF